MEARAQATNPGSSCVPFVPWLGSAPGAGIRSALVSHRRRGFETWYQKTCAPEPAIVIVPEITCRFADCHVFRLRPDGADEWLVLRRAPDILLGGAWAPVQGHIEDGETAYQTAFRELGEESGLPPEAFYQASYVNRFYLAATDQIILSPVFCARVPFEAPVVLSDEHTDFHWGSAEETMRRYVWPGQRKSLQICREQFVLNEPRPESEISALLAARPIET
jgi:dATP pyrophosphohydrolase